jgi:hypothetical protein
MRSNSHDSIKAVSLFSITFHLSLPETPAHARGLHDTCETVRGRRPAADHG